MFAKFREFINSIDQKKKTNLLVVGFLIGALGLTVVVSQQQTRSRQQAATNGSIQIINPVTGQEFPENRVFNPDAVYLKITRPDGWDLASSTNQNLLPKAYAQAPECREERKICEQPAYGNCDFYCDNGKAFYDCVQTNNSECKGTIYAACENSKCPQPTTRPTPVPTTSSTLVCSPGGVFDSVQCRRCAPDGGRWGEAGSDFGPSKGSRTWCSCAQRYQPDLYQTECAGSQTPAPTPPSSNGETPIPTPQPSTTGGGKILKSITIKNTDSGSDGKPEFTFGPRDEWYGQAISGKLYWALNKNPGPKTVSVTFTAEDDTATTTQSTPVLLFAVTDTLQPFTNVSPSFSPSSGTVDLSTHPEGLTFTWSSVPGATRYRLLITNMGDNTPKDNTCPPVPQLGRAKSGGVYSIWFVCKEGAITSYTVARDKFENRMEYVWSVQAMDDQGNVRGSQYSSIYIRDFLGVPGSTVTPAGPTPTPIPGTTTISLAVKLRGIGPKGPEGTPEARNNPNPVKTKRDLTLHFYEPGVDAVNDVNSAKRKFITFIQVVYDGNGKFVAKDIVIDKKVTTGDYGIYVKSPRYLPTQIPGTKRITAGAANQIDSLITLEPGDVDGNWLININDYNAYLSCFGKQTNDCVRLVDFNDDGKVDKKEPPPPDFSDYALFSQQFKPPQEP